MKLRLYLVMTFNVGLGQALGGAAIMVGCAPFACVAGALMAMMMCAAGIIWIDSTEDG